jgi:hypothetical protein
MHRKFWKRLALVAPAVGIAAATVGYVGYRRAMLDAREAWGRIASSPAPSDLRFDPAMVAGLPEIARRYFGHAIAPGTPLATAAELEMEGTFLLGDKASHQAYAMTARQILRPPHEFVWLPTLRSGAMRISGSDGLEGGRAWTSFWMMGAVPVANVSSSPNLVRSAAFRSVMESIWVPAALLPQNGTRWEQIGPDRARIRFTKTEPEVVIEMALGADGAVREIVGQRWSNANADGIFRLQPFGGTIEAEKSFGGFTVPSRMRIGNHFGTDDYLPFFQARIVALTPL